MRKENANNKIDFIIRWVDGNDEEWQVKKNKYSMKAGEGAIENRYRDWENLVYIFRGIDKFAPWVNKIYFVSDGQIPKWLNVKHPKLQIVNHTDFIPHQYLPTFSSRAIDFNLHRIQGLAEQFVVFDDDFFLLRSTAPTDFFVNGKPKDMIIEYPIMCSGHSMVFSNSLCNTFNVIGKYYSRKQYKKNLRFKMLNPCYGLYFFYNFIQYIIPYPKFFGMLTPHFPYRFLKSSYLELWNLEEELLNKTCQHKFRDRTDVNIYIFRLWNLLKGNFVPGNVMKMGKAFLISGEDPKIYKAIEKQKYKFICLNDECSNETFQDIKPKIIDSFEKILPEKCSFEIKE